MNQVYLESSSASPDASGPSSESAPTDAPLSTSESSSPAPQESSEASSEPDASESSSSEPETVATESVAPVAPQESSSEPTAPETSSEAVAPEEISSEPAVPETSSQSAAPEESTSEQASHDTSSEPAPLEASSEAAAPESSSESSVPVASSETPDIDAGVLIPGALPESEPQSPVEPEEPVSPIQETSSSAPIDSANSELPDPGDETDPDGLISPTACLFDGKVYVSAQQIPREDHCDFCFCFRGDIICLQQSCPPPIPGCLEETISGFCCPRYECPVRQVTHNVTLHHNQQHLSGLAGIPQGFNGELSPQDQDNEEQVEVEGCEIKGDFYRQGELVGPASGPCLECRYIHSNLHFFTTLLIS